MMGNRGAMHDEHRRLVRQTQLKRWIACVLEFRGRKRTVMTPRRYTELFFLDEATAYAAGHRPCAECRNPAYKRFRALWEANFGGPAGADAMDAVLHAERLDGRTKRTYRAEVSTLPNGTFVALEGAAHLVLDDALLRWSDTGYDRRRERPAHGTVDVLTPRSIVALFARGLTADVHPSARSVSR